VVAPAKSLRIIIHSGVGMSAHYERARLLSRQGRFAQAERELREALAEHPHWGQAHAFLGRCLARQNRLTEALEACEEGVRLSPDLPYAHYMLGLTYLDLNRHAQAEEALREALRLEPRNVEQLEWLSWIQFQRGDRRGAVATVDQGLAIDPEHVGCLNRRGYYLRWLGYWKESEAPLRAALKADPENAYTHTNLAWTLWSKAHGRVGNPGPIFQPWLVAWRAELREARRHFIEALRLDPTSDWARTGAAETLLIRWKAPIQSLMLLAVLTTALLGIANHTDPPVAAGAAASSPPDLPLIGLLLLLCGGVLVIFANGPLYVAMYWSRLGAAVLSPGRRLAATATTVCAAVAAGAGVAALLTPPPAACAILFIALAMIRPLTVVCEAAAGPIRNLLMLYAAVFAAAGLGLAAWICLNGEKSQGVAGVAGLLLVGGFIGSLASAGVAREITKSFANKTA
jgi:tetratricopeptide (TPR) repeat protein